MPGPYGHLNAVSIVHAGVRWNGHWRLDGGCVRVESAYGSRAAEVGRRKPELLAAEVLRQLADTWRARGG